jgi:type I restriction enzyme, S subunit
LELKSGYKQTEVGVIPEEWDVRTLACLAEKIMVGIASAATHAYRTKGIPLLRNQNIRAGYLDDSDILFVDREYEKTFRNKRLRMGDLLTARTGYPGVTCVVPPAYDGAQSFTTLITRPKPEEVQSAFLCSFINSAQGQRFFDQSQIGGAQKNVNAATLRKMAVPVPRVSEQRVIAEALSDVDALLGGLERLIAKKRDLKQAAMQKLLTGQTRLPGFKQKLEFTDTEAGRIPKDWLLVEVREVTRGHRQGYYTTNSYSNDGVRLVRITDLMNPQLDYISMPFLRITQSDHDLYGIRPGDFLIARSGAIGRYGIVYDDDRDAIFGSYIIRFTFDSTKLVNEFFGYLYQTRIVWRQLLAITQGSSNININASNIKSIKIPLPSVPEQTAITEVLTDMNAEIAALKQRREKTRALKQAMMQELLTGKTRLI